MIKTENITVNGREFVRTYSDAGLMIRKDGTDEVYAEAIDPVGSGRTYTETDEPVQEEDLTAEEALSIITGGAYETE